tara:strand:+ start:14071 stop:14820 length:750 start_codon:yes stop_codon:yes gene_type:complete
MIKNYKNFFYVYETSKSGNLKSKSASFAKKYKNATYSHSEGISGETYGIVTKNFYNKLLPLSEIKENIEKFLIYAEKNQQIDFFISKIACNEGEYEDYQIAPLFKYHSENCIFPADWFKYLKIKNKKIFIFSDKDFEDFDFLKSTISFYTQNLEEFSFIHNDTNLCISNTLNSLQKDHNIEIFPLLNISSKSKEFVKILNFNQIIYYANYFIIIKNKNNISADYLIDLCEEKNVNYRVVDYQKIIKNKS